MKPFKQVTPLDDESLTPWNHEDHYNQTPGNNRVKVNPYATKYFKRRNHSQSTKNIDKSFKRVDKQDFNSYKQFFDNNFHSYDEKSPSEGRSIKQAPNIFIKTMNITFSLLPEESQTNSEKSIKRDENLGFSKVVSCRSMSRGIKNRIHAPTQSSQLDSRKNIKKTNELFEHFPIKTTR